MELRSACRGGTAARLQSVLSLVRAFHAGQADLATFASVVRPMLRDLALREVNELHVEAGEKLNGSLIRAGLVDEFLVYLTPKLIGAGRGMAAFGPLQSLEQALPLEFTGTATLGPDLRILARVSGRSQF